MGVVIGVVIIMKSTLFSIAALGCLSSGAWAQEVLFQDDFRGKLAEGWSWVREHREAWRVTERGLEVRVEPGNMWGPANNARNVLVRPAPDTTQAEIEVGVSVENHPTNQYEQVDLVWYYDDSNMVKLGLELVDGRLNVVMGREENDQPRTVAVIPVDSASLRLRFFVKGNQIRGQFRAGEAQGWREVGECSLPVPPNGKAKVSLQFYQGPEKVEHWARVTEFRIWKVR
jgi:regulation of enolase protein 1 (concanavalin A-like superfamily)